MKSKEELKKLFENGDKPTQENFWEWQDSYWHKDEKLPTDNSGSYKIKGSVPDKVALDTMTSMVEGDVYNLLDTGDNYVYVSDLNNTGEPGWDKLSGIVDLSSINLQSVLDNGNNAVFDSGSINFDLINGSCGMNLHNSDYSSAGYFNHNISGYVSTIVGNGLTSNFNQYSNQFSLSVGGFGFSNVMLLFDTDNLLNYYEDYSDRFTDRSLVDKEYVDNRPSNANLQTVLDNRNIAQSSNLRNTITMELEGDNPSVGFSFSNEGMYYNFSHNGMSTQIYNDDQYGTSSLNVGYSGKVILDATNKELNLSTGVTLQGDSGFVYNEDYSQRFTERSLVDKGYVDNTIANSGGGVSDLQMVLNNGFTAVGSNEVNSVKFDLEGSVLEYVLSDNLNTSVINQSLDGITMDSNLLGARSSMYLYGSTLRFSSGESTYTGRSVSFHESTLFTYAADYSDLFVDRTLVDKAYVDSVSNNYATSSINPVTQSGLNAEFPNVKPGFEVYATSNDTIYKKINNSNEWCKIDISLNVEP